MTTDLDTMARASAADLHRRADAVDTEAALASLHRSAGTGRHRFGRLAPSGRGLAVAAAAVVLLAALAFAVGSGRGGDGGGERLGTQPSQPIDPTSYGPLLGRLHGVDAPELTAKVYGPVELQDGSEVAVSITGGRPGQRYLVSQCIAGTPLVNPAVNCTTSEPFEIRSGGTGIGVVSAWAVFEATGVPYPNDCRLLGCALQISPLVEEDQPDAGLPGTSFTPDRGDGREPGAPPSVPLVFAADAEAPPIPTMTVTYIDRTAEGVHVRIEGRDLTPGPIDLVASGYLEPPKGRWAHPMGAGPEPLAAAVVSPGGRLSATALLPDAITDRTVRTVNGVVQDPEVVACGVGTSVCDIWVLPRPGETPDTGGRGVLTPVPVLYPDEPR